ncbi:DnaJ subfamily C member 28 [Carex littledalei]|uniref:DnaJ subfamily C member 28 n=1 Tax=Carex littledalei TaxID=544730 RepID=A0A833RIT5_9POAL|nr:DnaJ subfamily C member 28 [Carex littledalei]
MVGAIATRRSGHLLPLMIRSMTRDRAIWYSSWAGPGSGPVPPSSSCSDPSSNASSSAQSNQKKLSHRLSAVIDAVNERKLPSELRGRGNAVRSETDIVNVVEQRIWHSMEEGHFENLPGKGKPLNLSTNPHADPAEDTLYRILSRNGCAPEWVELNKEIRGLIGRWRLALGRAWGSATWHEEEEALMGQMKEINNKVLRYNLIVPFGRQMFGLNWEKEIAKLGENNLQ